MRFSRQNKYCRRKIEREVEKGSPNGRYHRCHLMLSSSESDSPEKFQQNQYKVRQGTAASTYRTRPLDDKYIASKLPI